MRFSANLGFLWADLPLAEGIRRAHAAGFDAVETHFPHHEPVGDVQRALEATGLPMICLNVPPGDRARGDFGLMAVPGREKEAAEGLSCSIRLAREWQAPFVHAMAGKAEGPEAQAVLLAALRAAGKEAERAGVTLLIEPINPFDVPDYFLSGFDQAAALLEELDGLPVGLMLDCYHAARMGEDAFAIYDRLKKSVRHAQFAGTPGRGEPDTGSTDYKVLLKAIRNAGYDGFFGAEYRPAGMVEHGLGWLKGMRDL